MRIQLESACKSAFVFPITPQTRFASAPEVRWASLCWLALPVVAIAFSTRCSSPTAAPTGPAAVYDRARQSFGKGQADSYDKALDSLETLTNTDQPNDYTARARVLRAVILSGQMEGYKTLSEAYGKGADATKNPQNRTEYTSLRRDTARQAAELALKLGEVAMQLTKGGTVPAGLSLDAPYPAAGTPDSIPALDRVKEGLKIGQVDEEDAAVTAPRIGVLDALDTAVGDDGAKAKSALSAGPVSLNSADFALFLGEEVETGASFYDKKHINDPGRFKILTDIANSSAQAAQAALKDSPDPDRAKRLKKLQDRIKGSVKAQS